MAFFQLSSSPDRVLFERNPARAFQHKIILKNSSPRGRVKICKLLHYCNIWGTSLGIELITYESQSTSYTSEIKYNSVIPHVHCKSTTRWEMQTPKRRATVFKIQISPLASRLSRCATTPPIIYRSCSSINWYICASHNPTRWSELLNMILCKEES